MRCRYCNHEAKLEPGVMMIETPDGADFVHEECYQQSGDNEGYFERLHKYYKLFENEDGEDGLHGTHSL